VEIRVRLPRVPTGAGANVLGLLGLVAVVVAIGMLAGVAWAVLAGGLFGVGLAYVAQTQAAAAAPAERATEVTTELRRVA
jgi:hypothetical protein